jgi:hypothetical protein
MVGVPVANNTAIAVCYGKFLYDKKQGVSLLGVYFGGLGEDQKEADAIARECSAANKHVMVKTFPLNGQLLPRVIDQATLKFMEIEESMKSNFEIATRKIKRK